MIPELGHFALWLAAAAALLQAFAPTIGLWRQDNSLYGLATPAALAQFIFTAGSFAALAWAFMVSDFSVQLVVANSHSMKPDLYLFTGKNRKRAKVLLWDGTGLCLFAKRLERGRFIWPKAENGTVALSRAQLSMLLEGIDWRRPVRTAAPELAV